MNGWNELWTQEQWVHWVCAHVCVHVRVLCTMQFIHNFFGVVQNEAITLIQGHSTFYTSHFAFTSLAFVRANLAPLQRCGLCGLQQMFKFVLVECPCKPNLNKTEYTVYMGGTGWSCTRSVSFDGCFFLLPRQSILLSATPSPHHTQSSRGLLFWILHRYWFEYTW